MNRSGKPDLSQSLLAFRQALIAMGAWNRVKLFSVCGDSTVLPHDEAMTFVCGR